MPGMSRYLACVLALTACGGAPRGPAAAPAPSDPFAIKHEHWEDVSEQRFVYGDVCGMGPFEVTLPARRDDDPRFVYGRRLLFQVYGPRTLDLDSHLEIVDRVDTGIVFTGAEQASAHIACRVGDGAPIGVASVTAAPGGAPAAPAKPRELNLVRALDVPPAELPQLVAYTGPLPGPPRQGGAEALYPKGDPFYYADEWWSSSSVVPAGAAFKLRFWTRQPSNLSGIVFRVVEQRLAPELPEPGYAAEFAERVERVKQRKAAQLPEVRKQWDERIAHCKAAPEEPSCKAMHQVRGAMPPPPIAEKRPPSPSPDAEWVAGSWTWDDALADYTWVGGTYVVRREPAPVAPAPSSTPEPAPAVVVAPEPPAPPRELPAAVADVPAPEVEVIPPPPPQPAPTLVWIAGHWELAGTRWTWTPGRWAAVIAGVRYRAPAIHVRGAIRVYLPGGWIR